MVAVARVCTLCEVCFCRVAREGLSRLARDCDPAPPKPLPPETLEMFDETLDADAPPKNFDIFAFNDAAVEPDDAVESCVREESDPAEKTDEL